MCTKSNLYIDSKQLMHYFIYYFRLEFHWQTHFGGNTSFWLYFMVKSVILFPYWPSRFFIWLHHHFPFIWLNIDQETNIELVFLGFNDNHNNHTRFKSISHNPEKEINIRIPALIRSFILYDIHRFIAISRTHNAPFKHGGCCSRNRWLFVAHSKCEYKTIIWCGLWKKVTSLRNNQGNFFFSFLSCSIHFTNDKH